MTTIQAWKALQKSASQINKVKIKKLYMKDGLLAVYKPYGIPVHSGGKVKFSIADFFPTLEQRYNLPSGSLNFANRIDRNVPGVLMLTYNPDMAAYIAHLQRERQISKEYLTIVVGKSKRVHGDLFGDVIECEKKGRKQMMVSPKVSSMFDWFQVMLEPSVDAALTKFKILDNNKLSCMLCSFETKSGQKHQIRVHASQLMNCPILGEHKYHDGPPGPQPLPLRLMQILGLQGINGKIRPWQRALVPMHLLARKVIIPGLGEDNENLELVADIPGYFKKTMKDCDLIINRHELEAEYVPPKPRYAPLLDNMFLPKGVSPFHVEKESSF